MSIKLPSKELLIQRGLAFLLLITLFVLCFWVIRFFIVPALWGAILAYVTFPIYNFFHKKARFSANFSALIMTASISLMIGIPILIGIFVLQQEAWGLYSTLMSRLRAGYVDLPSGLKELPIIGQPIKDTLWQINKDPETALVTVRAWIQSHLYYGKLAFDVALSAAAKAGMTVMALFFYYRDGAQFALVVKNTLHNIVGPRVNGYIDSVAKTTQAVVYGIGLTAVAQSLLSGIAYYVAGAPAPILLTLLTFALALIPFGTPIAWGSVAIWLLTQDMTAQAIGLIIWGTLVVGSSDNVIRTLVISGATQIPFILIFIGVLGGLTAFGFVGLFIGPVVLAVSLAVWREWLHQRKYIDDKPPISAPIASEKG